MKKGLGVHVLNVFRKPPGLPKVVVVVLLPAELTCLNLTLADVLPGHGAPPSAFQVGVLGWW